MEHSRKILISALLGLSGVLLSGRAQGSTITLTLTPSNYHGYNVSCFGEKDGAIDLSVNGGVTELRQPTVTTSGLRTMACL